MLLSSEECVIRFIFCFHSSNKAYLRCSVDNLFHTCMHVTALHVRNASVSSLLYPIHLRFFLTLSPVRSFNCTVLTNTPQSLLLFFISLSLSDSDDCTKHQMVAYLTRFHYFLNDGLSRRPKWLFKLICVSLFIMIHVLLVISNAFKDEICGDKEITQNFHRDLKPSTLYFSYEVRISYNEILFSGFFFILRVFVAYIEKITGNKHLIYFHKNKVRKIWF